MKSVRGLVPLRAGVLVPFDPKTAADKDAQADAVIDYARRVKDWPTLELAIETKIEDQAEFVRWWRNAVRGDGRPGNGPRSATVLSCEDAEKLTGITKQQVSRWGAALKDPEAYRAKLFGKAYRVAMAGEPEAFRTCFTGNNEWFTPPEFLDLAKEVMGGIDLDPASHPLAQERVRAEQFFTRDNDGLNRKWHGRVWMNPPYSQPEIEQFIEKLICEISAGHVAEAIVLTNNSTDTTWFQKAALWANAICFTRGRIRFIAPDSATLSAPVQGQAFFYFGPNVDRFSQIFSEIGFIAESTGKAASLSATTFPSHRDDATPQNQGGARVAL